MEDSSTNPYIPRESEDVRKKVYGRQSPLGRVVKWALIATAVVAVLVGGGLFFVVPRTTDIDQAARVKLADALQPPDQTLKRVDVSSQLGFHFNYDNHVYSSYAEAGDSSAGSDSSTAIIEGQTYENNDLRVERAYNYVRIRPAESVDTSRSLAPNPPQLEIFATITSKDLATAAAIPENASLSKLSLLVKLDSDKRLAKKVSDDKTVVTIDATKPVAVTVGGIEYQKIRFTTTNNNHRISDVKYDDCYYTIQNTQPYTVCISGVRPTNASAASLVENVFNSLTFEQPQTTTDTGTSSAGTNAKTQSAVIKKATYRYPLAILTQTSTDKNSTTTTTTTDTSGDSGESPLLTITPTYYNDAGSLTAIAKTQPSVMRIGTLYCADLSLKYVSGDTAATITDACVGNVATGTAISKDGYIATTGHAIRNQKKAAIGGYINFAPDQDTMRDRLQTILDYLLKSKIILQSDADYLKTGAQIGDQEALAKIENIGSVIPDNFILPQHEEYTYAIQPTDKPIVVNKSDSSKPSFAYSDTVLEAKYVASDYDATKSVQGAFDDSTPSVDIGLLKVSGSYPDVAITSQQTVKTNDKLNILGYPAYAESSLAIDKIRNQPIATTTKVDQVYKKDTGQLIQIDDPVLPGNDGAPVVDNTGTVIGFAVYGLSYCPDQQCFANGSVRPASELLKLLDENNIHLQTGSTATASWTKGINEYFRANYSDATSAFASAASAYPFNVWGQPLQKLASSLQGSAKDTSLMNQLQAIMIVSLIVLVAVTIILAIAFFIHRQRINQLQVGHYGAAETVSNTPLASQPQPQPLPSQIAPLQSLPPLPTSDTANDTPTPPVVTLSESPVLPIHEQPPSLPIAVQPQIQKPPARIQVKDENDPKAPENPNSFYS